jgi:hypothetical protein
MKKIIFLALFLLSACAPAVPLVNGQPADVYGTSVALDLQLQASNQFLTGTAQADYQNQIVPITVTAAAAQVSAQETQAAFAMEQARAAATSTAAIQTQISAVTVTAQSWTPTPNAPATATQEAFLMIVAANERENERARSTNNLLAMAPYVVGFLLLFASVMAAIMLIKKNSFVPNPIDSFGKPQPMLSTFDNIAWDIDRAANGVIVADRKWVADLPAITAVRQDAVTEHAQRVDLATRVHRLPASLVKEQSVMAPQLASSTPEQLFGLPAWEIIEGWQSDKNNLPYYTAKGLTTFDLDRVHHLTVLGETGAGKSRLFLRTSIACSLAAGHRVIIIGMAKDYWPFVGHPNATLIQIGNLTDPAEAMRYSRFLEAAVAEMYRRDAVLTSSHQSTWSHAGRGRTIFVCDEFSNLLSVMEKSSRQDANQVRAQAEVLVAQSRSYGFHWWFAGQRATGMLGVYSQTKKVIFRVDVAEEANQRSLAGASSLADGFYLAKFGKSELAAGFNPDDNKLRLFMDSRPVSKLEDDWVIDGRATDVPSPALQHEAPFVLPDQDPAPVVADPDATLKELAECFRDQWRFGMSGRAFGRMIGHTYAGWWQSRIDKMQDYLAVSATSATTPEGV